MIRILMPITAAIFVLASTPAQSQALSNYGNESCARWAQLHTGPATADTKASDSWVFGYLDGVARYIDASNIVKNHRPINILKGLNSDSIVKLVGQYCSGHPTRKIVEVVSELNAQMAADHRSKMRPVRAHLLNAAPRRPAIETTGSGDITGSINTPAIAKCQVISVDNGQNSADRVVRKFRKCD